MDHGPWTYPECRSRLTMFERLNGSGTGMQAGGSRGEQTDWHCEPVRVPLLDRLRGGMEQGAAFIALLTSTLAITLGKYLTSLVKS